MIGEWLLVGAQWGVKIFGGVVIFISLVAALFVLIYIISSIITAGDKDFIVDGAKKKGAEREKRDDHHKPI